MGEEQGLSAGDLALVEKAFGPRYTLAIDAGYLPAISTGELARLIDAARAEGLQPPVKGGLEMAAADAVSSGVTEVETGGGA